MPLQLFKCHQQIKMNTSCQIFQPRGLFLWSFNLTLNLFSYPSLDVMQQLTNHKQQCGFALAVGDHHSNVFHFHHVDSSEDVWATLFECCIR